MSLNRVQRTFAKLAASQWMAGPYGRMPQYNRRRKKTIPVTKIKVSVIDAVTGNKTSGFASDESKAKFKKGDVIFNKEMGAGLINSVNISQGTDETYGFSYEVLFTGTPSTDRCRTAILLESQLIPYNEMSQVLFKKD